MMDSAFKVAGVGITPPVFKASGGISAGLQLMERVARLCSTQMLLMSDRHETAVENGLRVVRRRPGNLLWPLRGLLAKKMITMMWRPRLRAWLREERPDLVHFHNPHPPAALLQAATACRSLGIPYVISTHGFVEMNDYASGYGAKAWLKPLLRVAVRRPIVQVVRDAAHVLMLSPQEEPILRGMGASSDRLSVVTNGVDPYFMEAVPAAETEALVARFALPPAVPLLLFVGNHTPNKGLDVLLAALPQMKERAVAVVAGAIPSKASHARLLANAGMTADSKRLVFTDFITKEELRALYRSVDLFVFPSRADTLPLVILEAMASGLPVVATTVGGIPFEVSADTGVLVPPGDAAALSAALDRLCADAPLRESMGRAGRIRVAELFDWAVSAEKAVAIYRAVLHRGTA